MTINTIGYWRRLDRRSQKEITLMPRSVPETLLQHKEKKLLELEIQFRFQNNLVLLKSVKKLELNLEIKLWMDLLLDKHPILVDWEEDMPQPQKDQHLEKWQTQPQLVIIEVHREVGQMDNYQLQCNNKWQPKLQTVNMEEELQFDKFHKDKEESPLDKHLVHPVEQEMEWEVLHRLQFHLLNQK